METNTNTLTGTARDRYLAENRAVVVMARMKADGARCETIRTGRNGWPVVVNHDTGEQVAVG